MYKKVFSEYRLCDYLKFRNKFYDFNVFEIVGITPKHYNVIFYWNNFTIKDSVDIPYFLLDDLMRIVVSNVKLPFETNLSFRGII